MLEIDISADLTSEQKQRVSTIVYSASHAAASLVDHLPYPEGQFSANSELSSNEDSQKMTSKNLLYSLVLIVVGIISGVFLDEYVREIYEIKAPPRPSTVPSSARWEGGETGGNWFDCTRQQDSKYRCVVFSDTGDKVSDGVYGFVPEDFGGKLDPVLRSSDTDIVLRGARLVRSH